MAKSLVIVESPAKARTISGLLSGDDYIVESSMGHIRDLPRTANEIPDAYRGQPWARLGIDVDSDFKAIYVLDSDKSSHVKKLRKLASQVETIYLATDEDREGEAIAWHLLEELSPPEHVQVKRMVFHEITRQAIEQAVAEPRDIDIRLVEAQEARRMLDRLYGFEVSPVLWKKIKPQLSAGRVQSVAVRMIVERERERMKFKSAGYWSVQASLAAGGAGSDTGADGAGSDGAFAASVVSIDNQRIATGKDFNDAGELVHPKGAQATGAQAKGAQATTAQLLLLDETLATQVADSLTGAQVEVSSLTVKPYTRRPQPPFITSTLQQEAGNKLRLSSEATMRAAQSLYEEGYITYMRTDSTSLAKDAVAAARHQIQEKFGQDFLPSAPRNYKSKVKNAQEAHEAIRPAGGPNNQFRTPEAVAQKVPSAQAQVYELIYQRTLASQMTDTRGETVSAQFSCEADGRELALSASGTTITHPGWQAIYPKGSSEAPDLPPLDEGQKLISQEGTAAGHSTKPPARYTEASLIKQLEEQGIGRPSTYASIIRTIMNRGYVFKHKAQLVPDFTAFSVVKLLSTHFPDLVDYAFTARMEDDLDRIAKGEQERIPWLRKFYFGDGDSGNGKASDSTLGLKTLVSDHLDEIDPRDVNAVVLGDDSDGNQVVVRVGRYGPYVQRGDDSKTLPDGILPDELTAEKALDILSLPDQHTLGTDPETGLEVSVRTGRFGPYVQLGGTEDGGAGKSGAGAGKSGAGAGKSGKDAKPKRASLLASMTMENVTLEDALQLLNLPRTVGITDDGEIVTANNGRYGPFIRMGEETRSLQTEEQIFEVTLEECLKLLSEPKKFGRQAQRQAKVMRSIGVDPETDKAIELKDGRYGPYVTDGETNASVPKGDDPASVTLEQALELLQKRRARLAAKKGAGKSSAKKPAAKKPAAKKPAGAGSKKKS